LKNPTGWVIVPSIRSGALSLRIIPGDHAPPHVHVEGPGWEMRVKLVAPDVPWDIEGDPSRQEVRRALAAVRQHLAELRVLWKGVNVGPTG
jgi:hypothetical protein